MIDEYQTRIATFIQDRRRISKSLMTLKRKFPRAIDSLFSEAHAVAFENTDCLHCGNCCSTTSPIFIAADIDKLARHLRKTPGDFIEKFLIVDSDDGHFMLRQTPCPFLGSDKYCSVYESRPRACAGFPHTDRRGVAEILPLILRNAEICPAVAFMLCRLCPR